MSAKPSPSEFPEGAAEVPPSSGSPSRVSTKSQPIIITGIVGRLGRRLARRLHRDQRVIGIDRRPFADRPKDIEHHQIDIRRKKTRDVFRSTPIRAIVHLGIMHDPRASASEHHLWNVAGFQKILEYVAHYDVPELMLLSSANVYGPRPDNPQFLTEDAPLLGGASFSEIRDLVEIDMLAQSFFWKRPETETVDPAPGAHSRHGAQCSFQLSAPSRGADAARVRPDDAGHPRRRRGARHRARPHTGRARHLQFGRPPSRTRSHAC